MLSEILLAVIGLLGTGWVGWLTYRGTRVKVNQERSNSNFEHMQHEIDRLRRDLDLRDAQARATYQEVMELRKGLQDALIEIHALRLEVAQYYTGAEVLYNQLVENDIAPKFMPAGIADKGD